jgi:hypothetical protein
MKMKIAVLLVCFTVLGLFLTSCGGGKSALAGTWLLVEGRGFTDVELLKDGTGTVLDRTGNSAGSGAISWKVKKNRMYVTHTRGALSFDYQVAGSKLTLTEEDGDTLIYLKPGGSSELAGKWISTDGWVNLEFTKDGKGSTDALGFIWATDGNRLFMSGHNGYEYKISGSTLTLTNNDRKTFQLKKE